MRPVIDGFEARSSDFSTGLIVLTFAAPLGPAQGALLRAELESEGIALGPEADEDDETGELSESCFLPVSWLPPAAEAADTQKRMLERVATKFGAIAVHCMQVGSVLCVSEDDDDSEDGWRGDPPPQAESVPFPLEHRDQRLEEFDYEDFGVALKLADPARRGEEELLRALHAFWLAPYRDPEREDWSAYRHAEVVFDVERRSVLLWVDRFFVPVGPAELVGHLTWIVERLHAILPVTYARFEGASPALKYAALIGDGEPPFVLAGNPLRDVLARGEDPRAWAKAMLDHDAQRGGWDPRELGAMALELVYEVDSDEQAEEALRLIDMGMEFDANSADLVRCKLDVLLRHARIDEALATVRQRREVRVHLAQLGPLLRRDRVQPLRRLIAMSARFDANEASLTERLPRLVDVAPDLLPVLLKKLSDDESLIPGLHVVANELAGRDDDAHRDAAVAVFEAIFARPLPEEDAEPRQNYLSAWNNACVHAHAAKRFELASELADRAQLFVRHNPFITHGAACAYAAVGAHAKALEQVRLAIELGYEHLGKLEKDADLGPLLASPEFKALFAEWREKKNARRPANVPEGATWSESDNEWVLAPRDADNREHGLVRYFRPDGSLCCETEHEHGVPHGAFRRFHENGEQSREGVFIRGKLTGTNVFTRSTAETTEKFPQGLGEHIWRAELDFDEDVMVAGRTFGREGNRVREDGSPMPERPAGVTDDAYFGTEDGEDRWISGRTGLDGKRVGAWQSWDAEGTLLHEVSYRGGRKDGLERTLDRESGVARAQTFRDGQSFGEVAEHYPEGMMRDARIRVGRGAASEAGATKHGAWSFFDKSGAFVVSVDLGVIPASETFAALLVDRAQHASFWRAASYSLASQRNFAGALCALARSVGSNGPALALAPLLSAHNIPLGEEAREARAAAAIEDFERSAGKEASILSLMLAVLEGADAASVLRFAARVLDDHFDAPRAAGDFIRAAIALAPERRDLEQTRALIEMSIGRPEEADRAIARLGEREKDLAATLVTYRAYLYPRYEFWPARDAAASWALERAEPDDLPLRDAAMLRNAVQQSATRISMLRGALVAQVGERPWIAPAPDRLLPEGPVPVPMAVVDAVFVDEPAADSRRNVSAPDPRRIFGDTFGLDEDEQANVLVLERLIRTEWAVLGWLCFMAGLDRIGVPGSAHEPRAPRVLQEALMSRHDLLVDRANGDDAEIDGELDEAMASSDWYGQKVSELDVPNAEFALKEHKTLLNAVAWATDASRRSPWQNEGH